jgi:hypothetical protein
VNGRIARALDAGTDFQVCLARPGSGVIPVTMGGKVTLFGEGFDAAVCS